MDPATGAVILTIWTIVVVAGAIDALVNPPTVYSN